MPLDKKIRAVSIEPDAGKVRTVTDSAQPAVEFHQVEIRPEESRNDDHGRAIARRYAHSVVHRRGMQKENLGRKQRFGPGQDFGPWMTFRGVPATNPLDSFCDSSLCAQVHPEYCFSSTRLATSGDRLSRCGL